MRKLSGPHTRMRTVLYALAFAQLVHLSNSQPKCSYALSREARHVVDSVCLRCTCWERDPEAESGVAAAGGARWNHVTRQMSIIS